MALDGYELSPTGLADVKRSVEEQADDLPGLRKTMSTETDELMTASKMPQIAVALSELWNGVLAVQAEAAETRIANACTALGDVALAYNNADQKMMDDASDAAVQVPDIEIDDAKAVK